MSASLFNTIHIEIIKAFPCNSLFSNKFDYFCKLLSRLSIKADFPINKEPLSFFSDSAKDSDNTRSLIISGMSIPGNGY